MKSKGYLKVQATPDTQIWESPVFKILPLGVHKRRLWATMEVKETLEKIVSSLRVLNVSSVQVLIRCSKCSECSREVANQLRTHD